MKKNKLKFWIGGGIFCAAALLASIWYAVTFNDSRLVVPVDLGSYTFTPKDLPMILSVLLTCGYVLALFIPRCFGIRKRKGGHITSGGVGPKPKKAQKSQLRINLPGCR